jgi:tRNA A37 methylthiotransferase MiaB
VWIGSESGSQRILDAMERGVTVDEVQTAVALCRSSGIQTGMFLMWGYEGEQLEDVEATIQHVKKTDPDIFFTTVSYPIQGTEYASEVAGRVEHLQAWSVSSDRDVRIRGRHSRRFYGFADQLLRTEVELERTRRKSGIEAAVIAGLQNKVEDLRSGLHASSAEVEK